jgi:hypothetical protein
MKKITAKKKNLLTMEYNNIYIYDMNMMIVFFFIYI